MAILGVKAKRVLVPGKGIKGIYNSYVDKSYQYPWFYSSKLVVRVLTEYLEYRKRGK